MGETQNAYDIKANLDSKDTANKDLQNLFNQINELKDFKNGNADNSNDQIDGVLDIQNKLNDGLKTSLESCKAKDIRVLVTELGRIESDTSLTLDDDVKNSVTKLKGLLQNILSVKEEKPKSLKEFEGYINSGQLSKLNKLNRKEINEIVGFIQNGGLNENSAIKLCNDMYRAMMSPNKGRILSTDNENFNAVMNALKTTYPDKLNDMRTAIESEVSLDLDSVFEGEQDAESLLKILQSTTNISSWNGDNIKDITLKGDLGYKFEQKDFISRFNQENEKRIDSITTKGTDIINSNIVITFNQDGTIDTAKSMGLINKLGNSILNDAELNADHFKNVRQAWKDALDKAIEAKKNEGWDKMDETEKGKATEKGINEINEFLTGDKESMQFLKIEDKNESKEMSYNLVKAKEYLQSLLKNGENDAKRDDLKNLNGGAKKAWIAAVQIALNNLPNNSGKIKVDGIQATETDTAISNFQKGTMKIDNPDKKAGPETIQALINALDGQEKVEKVLNSSGYQNVVSPFGNKENDDKAYGVSDCQFYQKSNESDILCRSESEIFSLNKDTPRIKKIYEITESTNDNSTLTLRGSKVNVCSKGAEKLTELISDFDNNSTIEVGNNNDNFILKLGGNQQLTLDNDLFTNNDYFGQENIAERLQIAYVEAKLLADNKTKAEYNEVNTSSQNYRLPNGTKVQDFIAYYNSRHKTDAA